MYEDEQEGAASCYSSAISLAEMQSNYLTTRLRKKYPAEELDSCSSEEALSFCEPIAAACGFSVINWSEQETMTEDAVKNMAESENALFGQVNASGSEAMPVYSPPAL